MRDSPTIASSANLDPIMSTTPRDESDFLIVGGGSAGATLAARLSEDPGIRVLLVEAGPDTPPGAVPADIADTFPSSSLNPGYFWPGLTATRRPGGTAIPFPQARIMGGGSSVMGMWALRALPSDFRAWTRAAGWTWDDALRLYRGLEHDLDRNQRRNDPEPKPYPIRRVPRAEWPAFATALEAAAARGGLATIDDVKRRRETDSLPCR
jgi:choline dehydrogenase-like flavoprotein